MLRYAVVYFSTSAGMTRPVWEVWRLQQQNFSKLTPTLVCLINKFS